MNYFDDILQREVEIPPGGKFCRATSMDPAKGATEKIWTNEGPVWPIIWEVRCVLAEKHQGDHLYGKPRRESNGKPLSPYPAPTAVPRYTPMTDERMAELFLTRTPFISEHFLKYPTLRSRLMRIAVGDIRVQRELAHYSIEPLALGTDAG